MNIEDFLNIYDHAIDLTIDNSNLIELLQGYCEARNINDCDTEALLPVINIIKQNQAKLITELEENNLVLYKQLLEHNIIENETDTCT